MRRNIRRADKKVLRRGKIINQFFETYDSLKNLLKRSHFEPILLTVLNNKRKTLSVELETMYKYWKNIVVRIIGKNYKFRVKIIIFIIFRIFINFIFLISLLIT